MVRTLSKDEVKKLLDNPQRFMENPKLSFEDNLIIVSFRDQKNNKIIGYISDFFDITKEG